MAAKYRGTRKLGERMTKPRKSIIGKFFDIIFCGISMLIIIPIETILAIVLLPLEILWWFLDNK